MSCKEEFKHLLGKKHVLYIIHLYIQVTYAVELFCLTLCKPSDILKKYTLSVSLFEN